MLLERANDATVVVGALSTIAVPWTIYRMGRLLGSRIASGILAGLRLV
jgi:hypothetical protein